MHISQKKNKEGNLQDGWPHSCLSNECIGPHPPLLLGWVF